MPRATDKPKAASVKKAASKKRVTTKPSAEETTSSISSSLKMPSLSLPRFSNPTQTVKNFRPTKQTYLIALIIGLLLLGYYKKGWFVAATVNGAPLSNFELLSRMNQQYRSQVLNQMVNEKIILDAAKAKNVTVSKSDIDQKLSQIENNVGGSQALDSLLAQQGQTRDTLYQQLKLQVTIEKLYADEATVSAEEVQKYIVDNKDQLTATTSAEQTKEAEDILKQQKLAKVFNSKFQELKEQAKVLIF